MNETFETLRGFAKRVKERPAYEVLEAQCMLLRGALVNDDLDELGRQAMQVYVALEAIRGIREFPDRGFREWYKPRPMSPWALVGTIENFLMHPSAQSHNVALASVVGALKGFYGNSGERAFEDVCEVGVITGWGGEWGA